MNTTPDEALLALWLDDELQGEELARMEAWASGQPEQLAAREEVREWRQSIAAVIPADEEPPYADFFNSRIEKSIREQTAAVERMIETDSAPAKAPFWRSWFVPATAFAGMALAFWVGTKTHSDMADKPLAKAEEPGISPVYYTPEQGVNAEWVKGAGESATVIVLQGVNAIPDALDFSETVSYPNPDAPASADATAAPKLAR
jgi:hypothetical protein